MRAPLVALLALYLAATPSIQHPNIARTGFLRSAHHGGKLAEFAEIDSLSEVAQNTSAVVEQLTQDLIMDDMKFEKCWSGSRYGWEDYENYTSHFRRIVLEQDAWDSARLSTNIFYRLVSEIMGFKVNYREYWGGYDNVLGPRLHAGISDVVMEMWITGVPVTWRDHGSIGYTGRSGMYVPSWIADQNPLLAFDFWRFFQNPAAIDIMQKRIWKPQVFKADGSPICTDIENGCSNNVYRPKWWTAAQDDRFVNMLGIDPSWSQYHYERLIDGLELNATMTWLGDTDFYGIVGEALANGTACVFYHWKPSAFVAVNNVTRLMFPDVNDDATQKFLVDPAHSPIRNDEASSLITKASPFNFVDEFPDVSKLLNLITISEKQINDLLGAMQFKNMTYDAAVCDWMRKSEAQWSQWIPPPPVLLSSCGFGQGLYLSNNLPVCFVCPRGSYNWDEYNTKECKPCPPNAVCPGGSVVRHETPTVELLFLYFQVIHLIFGVTTTDMSGMSSLHLFLALTSLDIDGMATDCPVNLSGVSKQLFRFLLPFLFFIHTFILYTLANVFRKQFPEQWKVFIGYLPRQGNHISVRVIFLRILQMVGTFVLMPLVEASLAILDCRKIAGLYVDFQAPDEQCFQGAHLPAAIFAIVMLVILLGVYPVTLGYQLYRIQKAGKLKYEDAGDGQHLTVLDELNMTVYEDYRRDYFYMGPIVIWEKGILVLLFKLLVGKVEAIGFTFVVILAVLCFQRIYIQPYRYGLEAYVNREICLCWLTIMAVLLSTLQFAQNVGSSITFLIVLPPALHFIRWCNAAYAKYRSPVIDAQEYDPVPVSQVGSAQSGGTTSLHRTSSKMAKGNSIENLVKMGSVRASSLMRQPSTASAGGAAAAAAALAAARKVSASDASARAVALDSVVSNKGP
ncbi:hypothetical protein CcCBS67573_g04706 [Chytriomyces confervae]|uniref:ABC-type glycine betaine transport system substrate-binding domain-containing protein n=1 Tax=Chytriomyces confervae TaxID=246404 RepID=A0A507FE40_9FUNG|nr:hypothetical protein CcCBS67573_g04706 [Chytriomyces confervae]